MCCKTCVAMKISLNTVNNSSKNSISVGPTPQPCVTVTTGKLDQE